MTQGDTKSDKWTSKQSAFSSPATVTRSGTGDLNRLTRQHQPAAMRLAPGW